MSTFTSTALLPLLALLSTPSDGAAANESLLPPRALVERSVPYLEREGVAWMERRKCVSCHQVSYMLWSLNDIHAAGIAGEVEQLAAWTTWSIDSENWNAVNVKITEQESAARNADMLGQLILGRAEADSQSEWSERFAAYLLESQQAEGFWKGGGQLPLQLRPEREMNEVTTLRTLLALRSSRVSQPGSAEAAERALAWLKESSPGTSTEWWTMWVLFELDRGDLSEANRYAAGLLAAQNADGGWGWLMRSASDALGTGMALYALGKLGSAEHRAAIDNAQQFLAATQAEDGSWLVPSTRKKDAGRITPTATYWGTAWAAMGLVATLPE